MHISYKSAFFFYSAHKLSALDTSYRPGNLPYYKALSRFMITQILYRAMTKQTNVAALIDDMQHHKFLKIQNMVQVHHDSIMEIRKNDLRTS